MQRAYRIVGSEKRSSCEITQMLSLGTFCSWGENASDCHYQTWFKPKSAQKLQDLSLNVKSQPQRYEVHVLTEGSSLAPGSGNI